MSPENDLVYPADGMRRLLAMEKTNGIWTQKMLLKLERKMVNIMDHENKEIVERFPLGLIREPTAFTSNDPKELYNNILIFIVGKSKSIMLERVKTKFFEVLRVLCGALNMPAIHGNNKFDPLCKQYVLSEPAKLEEKMQHV